MLVSLVDQEFFFAECFQNLKTSLYFMVLDYLLLEKDMIDNILHRRGQFDVVSNNGQKLRLHTTAK